MLSWIFATLTLILLSLVGNFTVQVSSSANENGDSYYLTTVAGSFARSDRNTNQGCGYTDGVGTFAAFRNPQGITIDQETRTMFISDANNHLIRRISLCCSNVETVAGTALSYGYNDGIGTFSRFSFPQGISFDNRTSRLYIADMGNSAIRILHAKDLMLVTTLAGSAGINSHVNGIGTFAYFSQPRRLALSSLNNMLYIDDSGNHCIRAINLYTLFVSTLTADTDLFSRTLPRFPADYFRLFTADTNDAVGKLLDVKDIQNTEKDIQGHQNICDTQNNLNAIQQMSYPSQSSDDYFAQFHSPVDIAYDSETDLLYFIDAGNNLIRRIERKKKLFLLTLDHNASIFGDTTVKYQLRDHDAAESFKLSVILIYVSFMAAAAVSATLVWFFRRSITSGAIEAIPIFEIVKSVVVSFLSLATFVSMASFVSVERPMNGLAAASIITQVYMSLISLLLALNSFFYARPTNLRPFMTPLENNPKSFMLSLVIISAVILSMMNVHSVKLYPWRQTSVTLSEGGYPTSKIHYFTLLIGLLYSGLFLTYTSIALNALRNSSIASGFFVIVLPLSSSALLVIYYLAKLIVLDIRLMFQPRAVAEQNIIEEDNFEGNLNPIARNRTGVEAI